MPRNLSPDEKAVWSKVTRSVRPIKQAPAAKTAIAAASQTEARTVKPPSPSKLKPVQIPQPRAIVTPLATPKPIGETLDGNWDKSFATGKAAPDRTIDLHGHTLASAHALLDHALGDAIRQGARLILLITGKPAAHNPRMPPTGRGVIRASVIDWIEAGPHAPRIAAIRGAHPRHGGAGALYIVIRRHRLA